MTVIDLLDRLRAAQIEIAADGERLRIRAPHGALTDELRAAVAAHKPELLDLLVRTTGGGTAPAPIAPRPRGGAIPASFAQQRLWMVHQLEPGNPAYNLRGAVRLVGALDASALERTIAEIVRRHETLRSTVHLDGSDVVVRPATTSATVRLQIVDLSSAPAADAEAEVRRLVDQECLRPFDLAAGPLLRAVVYRLRDDDHVLLFVLHHIVADGWSLGLFRHELGVLYAAFVEGRPSPLPEPPIQYADFATWQRERLAGPIAEQQLAYWTERLTGAPALDLPTDRPRPPAQSLRGAMEVITLPRDAADAVKALSQQEGVTLFMTMLSALSVMLSRYSGQRDIIVGSPIANRTQPELENLIGFFVNNLVMRVDLSGNPTGRELLRRTRETALGAYAHQDLPFDRLIEALHPERDLARNPIFQVMLAVQNMPAAALDLPTLTLRSYETEVVTTRMDLELYVRDFPGGLLMQFVYATDLFDAGTIRRMQSHMCRLLRSLGETPDAPVAQLAMLDDDERRQLVTGWNDTRMRAADVILVHDRVARHAATQPAAAAVTGADGRTLSYDALNRAANQLAHALRSWGVGPDVPVVVFMARSPELIVAELAVLKAGGAFVPVDPGYPAKRVAFTVADTGTPVVLTQARLKDTVVAATARVFAVDTEWQTVASRPDTAPAVPLHPENLAYVIYTSGSTGEPKGVQVPHRGLMNLVDWHVRVYGVTAADRATQLAGVGFDASVWEVWPYLACGAEMHVPDEATVLDPPALLAWMARRRITMAFIPTPLAEAALREAVPDDLALRAIHTGGDRLGRGLPAPLGFALVNHYGPTENSVVTTSATVAVTGPGDPPPPIGRPIDNVRAYVLDTNFAPVPVGVPGELHIAGDSLARGYHGRADLTADRFVPNPFASSPGERMYRTGDVVRYQPDGNIQFLRRSDDQVKIRGFRIELGEVEAVLRQHPTVEDAVVMVRDDASGERRLAAYVIAASGAADAQELEGQHVDQWRSLYDQTYGVPEATGDPTFNITGWNSSYSGEPIAAGEMREWVDATVSRILELAPRRVLEIGCGTGLLLYRVAPHVERYDACDFSAVALAQIQRQMDAAGGFAHVSLAQRMADDLRGYPAGAFDLVVINSVIQYFPDIDYLVRVIAGALEVLAPGGRLFIGDVRHLPLLPAFHSAIQFHRDATLPPDQFLGRVTQSAADEEELVIDPAFFAALPQVMPRLARARVLLKRGRARNELTQFRYDVVIETDPAARGRGGALSLEWDDRFDTAALRERLALASGDVRVTGIPNARVTAEARLLQEVSSGLPPRLSDAGGVDPEDLWVAAEGLPYEPLVTYSASRGAAFVDVEYRRRTAERADPTPAGEPPAAVGTPDWRRFANDPARARTAREEMPRWRAFAAERLPDYMVPSAFVVLDRFPLTANGKVDRRALPAPESYLRGDTAYVEPRNELEEAIAEVWTLVLGVNRPGIHDNFFDAGGHSLMATRVVARIRDTFGVDIGVRSLFEQPTIAGLADALLERMLERDAGAESSDKSFIR